VFIIRFVEAIDEVVARHAAMEDFRCDPKGIELRESRLLNAAGDPRYLSQTKCSNLNRSEMPKTADLFFIQMKVRTLRRCKPRWRPHREAVKDSSRGLRESATPGTQIEYPRTSKWCQNSICLSPRRPRQRTLNSPRLLTENWVC
jgi:hypothetical protein